MGEIIRVENKNTAIYNFKWEKRNREIRGGIMKTKNILKGDMDIQKSGGFLNVIQDNSDPIRECRLI